MLAGQPRPADAPLRGILLVCLAVMCFVSMNTIVKHLAETYPLPEVIWGRYFFHFVLVLVLFPHRIPTLLQSSHKPFQILRSVLVLMATGCMFTAVHFMPLANVVSITFFAPLIVTGLSVLVLREKVGPRRWAAVFTGFIGVLIIIRPGAGVFHWAALAALGQATFYATYQIVTRMVSHAAHPLNALFYAALVGAVVMTGVVPFFWVTPAPLDWLLMAGTGLFGGAGHLAIIRAYERAEASAIAPFAYTELIWATIAGYFVFGDFPDAWTFVGAVIIAGSGLYVLHRERSRRGVAAAVTPETGA